MIILTTPTDIAQFNLGLFLSLRPSDTLAVLSFVHNIYHLLLASRSDTSYWVIVQYELSTAYTLV